jgi:hypothetical protein
MDFLPKTANLQGGDTRKTRKTRNTHNIHLPYFPEFLTCFLHRVFVSRGAALDNRAHAVEGVILLVRQCLDIFHQLSIYQKSMFVRYYILFIRHMYLSSALP